MCWDAQINVINLLCEHETFLLPSDVIERRWKNNLPGHCGSGIFWTHLGIHAGLAWLYHNQCLASWTGPWSDVWLCCQYPLAYAMFATIKRTKIVSKEITAVYQKYWWNLERDLFRFPIEHCPRFITPLLVKKTFGLTTNTWKPIHQYQYTELMQQ